MVRFFASRTERSLINLYIYVCVNGNLSISCVMLDTRVMILLLKVVAVYNLEFSHVVL